LLLSGLSEHHHAVSTTNRAAQSFFDQGLRLIYAFNHDEAERSFRRAAELDPKLAMAHWGIAFCLGANINLPAVPDRQKRAHAAIQEALKRADAAPPAERDYINALARRYPADENANEETRNRYAADYASAMRELMKRYPDDPDAAVLFADSMMNLRPWKLYALDGTPAEGTEEIVGTLSAVLKRSPDHLGANHLFIHAVEASRHPEVALPSAARLGSLTPAAGHLVHMPAHIYLRVGDYAGAVGVNVNAAAVDRAYIEQTGATGWYPAMYFSHNLHFIAYTESMRGREPSARRAAAQVAENVAPYVESIPMLEGFLTVEPSVLARFHKWDDLLSRPVPSTNGVVSHSFARFVRGLAFAAKGNPTAAAGERTAYLASIASVPPDAAIGLSPATNVFRVATELLEARIASAKSDEAGALDHLRAAVAAQDQLSYDEPPDFFYPVRETLGAALLRSGKAAEAEQVFRDELNRNPRNGRSLFGLMKALEAQAKSEAAGWVRHEFDAAWKDADFALTLDLL
jgi:tetratricopeptide (TPR) repeat protein